MSRHGVTSLFVQETLTGLDTMQQDINDLETSSMSLMICISVEGLTIVPRPGKHFTLRQGAKKK